MELSIFVIGAIALAGQAAAFHGSLGASHYLHDKVDCTRRSLQQITLPAHSGQHVLVEDLTIALAARGAGSREFSFFSPSLFVIP
jgi:hypothetical protein